MFYGIEAEGNEFVFVVDMSGSMEGSRFRRARNELRRSIEALWPYQRYFVIFFSDGAYPMPAEELLPRTEKNVQATVRWLNQIRCDGPTNPLPALLQAIDMEPDAVFLLSDGKFPMEIVVEVGQYRTGNAIPIHTISFASREGEPMLKAIAKATGGTYRYVK
jgi:Mg-chelatase subunit ChlD